MDGRCPRCDTLVPEGVDHGLEQCIAELRDQREGLNSAVETVMRALKIALRKHNEALAREAVALDALKQAEEECEKARKRGQKDRRALNSLATKVATLIGERDAARGQPAGSSAAEGEP